MALVEACYKANPHRDSAPQAYANYRNKEKQRQKTNKALNRYPEREGLRRGTLFINSVQIRAQDSFKKISVEFCKVSIYEKCAFSFP